VTAVCSSANVHLVRSLGADHVIDYTAQDFTDGGPVHDVIVDVLGKAGFPRSLRAADLVFLQDLIDAGKMRTVIERRYSLDEIAEAHRYADTDHKVGNVAVLIGDQTEHPFGAVRPRVRRAAIGIITACRPTSEANK
jgi:NADPH:quinone reductase-like Zn-dependent oxidoreductase